ncbi:MAG: tetratricopeptide repeat protein [Bacteroidales bacterium]|jgi:tetratricopeptide (TPR) repeat protein|nr:tetratricopeptide repeat protein [Bacteroidales bacterium]
MKRRTIFVLVVFLTVSVPGLYALDNLPIEQYFQQAAEFYQQEEYRQALDNYLQIMDNGYEGAVLFYNIGNCYFKLHEKSQALLWYERALRLDPSNEDIKHNISYINQTLIDKIDKMPEFLLVQWWNNLSRSMTSNGWAVVSIVACLLFFTMLLLIIIARRRWLQSISLLLSIVFFVCLVITIVFSRKEQLRYVKNQEAIITQSVVIAKSTPTHSGSDLFAIHEGLKVAITDRIGEWYEIKLSNGEKGWVEGENLEKI